MTVQPVFETVRERWHFKKIEDNLVDATAKKYSLDSLLARLLLVRNIGNGDEAAVEEFLFPPKRLLTAIENITAPEDLERATNRVKRALDQGEKIMINGDPDADGITGATILVAGLRQLGIEVLYDFPTRSREGHGLQPRIIDEAKRLGAMLIITSDCGSKDTHATAYANSLGLEVIICDHHILGKQLPEALAIINPFRVQGPNPFKAMSGAGMAFKFMAAVFHKLNRKIPTELWDYFLILAALGTISDRMSLLAPVNRILVKRGIEALNQTQLEGLKTLKEVSSNYEVDLRPRDIARTIVPRLNAPGRIGDKSLGIPDSNLVVDLLLLGMAPSDDVEADVVKAKFRDVLAHERNSREQGSALQEVALVDDVNEKRKYITSKIEDEIESLIENQVNPNDKIIIVTGQNWNPGVIGIDTDRLRDRFLRPAMILTEYSDNPYVRGSVRSIPTINMYEIVERVSEHFEEAHNQQLFLVEVQAESGKKMINAFGGHSQACGFTLHRDHVQEFKTRIHAEMEKLPPNNFHYAYEIVDILKFNQLSPKLIHVLDRMIPYGQAFEFPLFYMKGCKLGRGRPFGNRYQENRTPHVDFFVGSPVDGKRKSVDQRISAVGFGLWEKFGQLMAENSDGDFDIIFFLEFSQKPKRQKAKLRLNVVDIRVSHPENLEQLSR